MSDGNAWNADPSFDREAFWEGKILKWENGRYELQGGEPGLLQRIADWSSRSLRFRLSHTAALLAPHVAGRTVVDVGCGSGLLAGPLLEAGAASYVGYDIAPSAIETARARASEQGWDRATFEVGTIDTLPQLEADLVVSLGLTDWLTDDELDTLFARSGDAHYFHAISERRQVPSQWLHRLYCWVSYGYRSKGYVPRYFGMDAFAARLQRHRPGPVYAVRDPRLTFGALVTSLPVAPRVRA